MTTASDLDRLVQFRRAVESEGPLGTVHAWADHGSPAWASKKDISDGERWRAGEVGASVTTRFVVRWSALTAGLTPKDRLTCDGREYEITALKEIGRRQFIEITASARSDQ